VLNFKIKHSSIHSKILIFYLGVFSLIFIMGAFSIYCFVTLKNTVNRLVNNDLEAEILVRHIYSDFNTIEGDHLSFLWLGKSSNGIQRIKEAQSKIISIKKTIQELYNYNLSKKELMILKNLSPQIDIITQEIQQDLTTATDQNVPNAQEREIRLRKLYSNIFNNLYNITRQIEQNIEKKTAKLSQKAQEMTMIVIGVDIAILIFLSVIPYLIYKHIIQKPLKALKEGTERIARGDFSHKIYIDSNDEFGDLAKAFNTMNEKLKQLDQMKSDFIAIITHELRTPLSSMIEAVNLLSELTTSSQELSREDIAELARIVKDDLRRLNALIDDVLDLSRLEAKLLRLNLYPTDIKSCIKNVITSLKPMAIEKAVTINFETEFEVLVLEVDEEKMHRALLNLLNNAIKFSPSDSEIKIKLNRIKKEGKEYAQIIITDQGPGISPSEQKLIFDKFYQIKMKKQKGGSGLGLTIAKGIIENHGGSIYVKSPIYKSTTGDHKGIGTSFIIELPMKYEHEAHQ